MYTTIYIGEKPVILIEQDDPLVDSYRHNPNVIFFNEISTKVIHTVLHEIKQESVRAIMICQPELDSIEESFFKHFSVIQAAGGLVTNEKNELLIIYRRGKWDLPKGKIDEGETPEQCAVREVAEETGLTGINLLSPFYETFHVYQEYGKNILKQTFWYSMSVSGEQNLKPQTEEDIESIRWIEKDEWAAYSTNTYSSIKEVMSHYLSGN